MTPSVDLPPLPFLPSAEERIKMVRWGTEIALAERARLGVGIPAAWLEPGAVVPVNAETVRLLLAAIRKGE